MDGEIKRLGKRPVLQRRGGVIWLERSREGSREADAKTELNLVGSGGFNRVVNMTTGVRCDFVYVPSSKYWAR
ncbi:hypothetical protein Syun_018029 [Stephania yunnanensis]|uniref:Uncharacterized protein n=1 Tax=Stephania yunnanensis TaxID=152371 RepID=A0AAP0NUM5_9MAGN